MAYSQAEKIRRMEAAHPYYRKSPLDKALDTLNTVALGYFGYQEKLKAKEDSKLQEEERWDRRIRLDNVSRLRAQNPDIDTIKFGDVVGDLDAYTAYLAEIDIKKSMEKFGKEFSPVGGVVSEEAQTDLFTYGETRRSLDATPNITSFDDLLNFDAYLLGEQGRGRDIAKRHNWIGLLNDAETDEDSQYFGLYTLDEGEYIDLKDKGLISHMSPDENGLYTLDKTQRDNLVKNYEYWKTGFEGSRDLKTKSEISSSIVESNIADMNLESKLRKSGQFKEKFDNIANWNDFIDPDSDRWTMVELGWNDEPKFSTDYIDPETITASNPDGIRERDSLNQEEFMEKYPNVYNFIYGYQSIEAAREAYISNENLQIELSLIPTLQTEILQKFEDLAVIEVERRQIGLDMNQINYTNESAIMVEARDILLNDLQSADLGRGILFDEVAFSNLTEEQQNNLVTQLQNLEHSYFDRSPGNINYNPNVARFLQLYGLGKEGMAPGEAVENLLEEMRTRGKEPVR